MFAFLTKEQAVSLKKNEPCVGEYKGHTLLVLDPLERFPFQFGIGKAKKIVQHFAAIKAFVEKYGGRSSGQEGGGE
jgi:hypothetical protein